MFKVGDNIQRKNLIHLKYKIISEWKNIFGDQMYDLQLVSNQHVKIVEFKKYTEQDYELSS